MISPLAWIKRPAAAPDLKLHELVALCSAALKPSRELWDTFITHLRKLEQQGTITSDEAAAIVASQLTETLLLDMEAGDPDDVDADTLTEVVDRVREDYRREADKLVSEAEARHKEAQLLADARVADAQQTAGRESEHRRQLELQLNGRINVAAGLLAWAVFIVILALVAAGTAIGLAQGFNPQTAAGTVMVWVATGMVALVGLAMTIWGGSLVEWRMAVRDWIRRRLAKILVGDPEWTPRE
jgi:hypothetical protein